MTKPVLYIISAVLGAGIGYLIYKFIGCRSGSCPITSNPYMSIVWGVLFTVTLAANFVDKLVK